MHTQVYYIEVWYEVVHIAWTRYSGELLTFRPRALIFSSSHFYLFYLFMVASIFISAAFMLYMCA